MDKLNLMKIFVAVVDSRGLAGAARKLNISPPAVTRAVNQLESELGTRLLARTTRVVRVTDAGALYVEDCRRILAELDEADESIRGTHTALLGRLTLTAPILFGALHVTPIVTEYLGRFPDVTASCLFLDRVVNLMEEGVDVAVRIGALPDSSVQAIPVGKVRRVICASPAYLKRHGTPQSLADLTQHCVVSSSSVNPLPDWQFFESGRVRHLKLAARLTTTTNDAALAAVVGGFGLARVLSYQVADLVSRGKLKLLLTDVEPAALPVHVVHRQGNKAPQRVRAFLDLAIDRLRANPALH